MTFIPQQVAGPTLMLILFLFLLKHFLADFVLQPGWMAKGKAAQHGWRIPLFLHAAIHGLLTYALILFLAPSHWWLAFVDFLVHFAIDRGKALASLRWNATPQQPEYWWLFGADQMLHQLTHLVFALVIASV